MGTVGDIFSGRELGPHWPGFSLPRAASHGLETDAGVQEEEEQKSGSVGSQASRSMTKTGFGESISREEWLSITAKRYIDRRTGE